MKKNSGYTLVELIVVIAIMAVMAGSSVIAFASLRTYRAKTAKDEICNSLKETRTQAMAKQTEWMEIYEDSDGLLRIRHSYNGNDTRLGGYLHISYTVEGAAAETEITGTNTLILTYDRATGGFEGIKTSTTADANGKLPNMMSGSSVVYCRTIHVQNQAKNKGYTITLNKETGRFDCVED